MLHKRWWFSLFVVCLLCLPAAAQDEIYVTVTEISSGTANVRQGNVVDALVVGAQIPLQSVIEIQGFATVSVLCPDRTRDVITETRAPNCAATGQFEVQIDGLVVVYPQVRPANPPDLYVITPRNTMLLSGDPRIEWTPITDVDGVTYRVRVEDINANVFWIKEGLTEPWLDYPADQNHLHALDARGEPIQYLISVEAFDGNIPIPVNPDPNNQQPILIAPPNIRTQVFNELSTLEQAQLPPDSANSLLPLLRARLLSNWGFHADALNELRLIAAQGAGGTPSTGNLATSPILYQELGKIYASTLLRIEAVEAYQQAIELGGTFGHVRSQAEAYESIGNLSLLPDDKRTAYEQALLLYQQLGDNAAITRVESALAGL